MSKAEERALEAFPLKIDGDSRGSYDLNVVKRIVYQQGYEQAEKDLELSWKDIKLLIDIVDSESLKPHLFDEIDYQEVLKRIQRKVSNNG